MQPKISNAFAISVIVVLAVLFGWLIWLTGSIEELGRKTIDTNAKQSGSNGISGSNGGNAGVACTQEAKLCPDGKTSVGRTGQNCEFAACPGESNKESSALDTSDWKTYRNDTYGFEFKYPKEYSISKPKGLPDFSAYLDGLYVKTDQFPHDPLLSVSIYTSNDDPKQFFEHGKKTPLPRDEESVSQELVIDGHRAYFGKEISSYMYIRYHYLIQIDGKTLLSIVFESENNEGLSREEYLPIVQNIVETIHFL